MSSIETIAHNNSATDERVKSEPYTIRCYLDIAIVRSTKRKALSGERLLAAQALRVLLRLDSELIEARADWNQDRFRRLMHLRRKVVSRVLRRWIGINPPPAFPLGNLRRRYHANLAGHLNEGKK